MAIWKLKMATWQLQMAIWTFKMAIWKLKNEHFEAQKGQNLQNAAFEPPMFQNDTPNFGANSLSSPSTVFQGKWPNQGGAHKTTPRSDNL